MNRTVFFFATLHLLVGAAPSLRAQGLANNGTYTVVVDRQPAFPGGQPALTRFLTKHLRYPSALADQQRELGETVVQFVIGRDGQVGDVRVRTKATATSAEKDVSDYWLKLVKAVEKMPRWEPAQKNGQPIAYLYTMPIQVAVR